MGLGYDVSGSGSRCLPGVAQAYWTLVQYNRPGMRGEQGASDARERLANTKIRPRQRRVSMVPNCVSRGGRERAAASTKCERVRGRMGERDSALPLRGRHAPIARFGRFAIAARRRNANASCRTGRRHDTRRRAECAIPPLDGDTRTPAGVRDAVTCHCVTSITTRLDATYVCTATILFDTDTISPLSLAISCRASWPGRRGNATISLMRSRYSRRSRVR